MIEGDDGIMSLGAEAPRGCGGLFGNIVWWMRRSAAADAC